MTLEDQHTDRKSLRAVVGNTTDWLKVTIQHRIVKPEAMRLLTEADERFQLTQRERIMFDALAQTEGMTAKKLGIVLETDELAGWLGRLIDKDLVHTKGKTSGMWYFVAPNWLRGAQLDSKPALAELHSIGCRR